MAAGYTLQRSLAPSKPVYNTEWHGSSTVEWRDEAMSRQYIETAVWVGLYHGEAMNVAWYWPRAGVAPQAASKFSVSFAGSFGTQPTAVDAFLRQFMAATVNGGTVAAVGRLAPRVWLLRSWSSLALNSDSYDALLGTFEAASFLGLPVGMLFEEPARLAALDGSNDVVLVPGSTHAEEATVGWLRARAAARPGSVVLTYSSKAPSAGPGAQYLGYSPAGVARPAADVAFVSRLPAVNITSAADALAVLAHLDAVAALLPTAPARCTPPEDPWGGPAFGVLCRFALSEGHVRGLVINLNAKPVRIAVVSAVHDREPAAVTELRSGAKLPNPLSLSPGAVRVLNLGPADLRVRV